LCPQDRATAIHFAAGTEALLKRQQLVLVARLQAAQAELAEQTRLSESSGSPGSCTT